MKQRVLFAVAIALAVLGTLAVRVVVEGRRALARGDEALAAKQPAEAIAGWESAARWYLPFAPHVDEAYERLVGLATSDPAHALAGWRAVRAAAHATRSLWTPHSDDLAAADDAIAKLSAEHPEAARAGGTDPTATPGSASRLAWHQTQLQRDPRPSGVAAGLALVGIACWLAGIGWLVRRGLDDQGQLVRRPAIAAAAVTVLGVVGWAAGLYAA